MVSQARQQEDARSRTGGRGWQAQKDQHEEAAGKEYWIEFLDWMGSQAQENAHSRTGGCGQHAQKDQQEEVQKAGGEDWIGSQAQEDARSRTGGRGRQQEAQKDQQEEAQKAGDGEDWMGSEGGGVEGDRGLWVIQGSPTKRHIL